VTVTFDVDGRAALRERSVTDNPIVFAMRMTVRDMEWKLSAIMRLKWG